MRRCPPIGWDSVTNCTCDTSLEKVQDLCDNKVTCVLCAMNDVFGDPCEEVFKYLNVTYDCKGKFTIADLGDYS